MGDLDIARSVVSAIRSPILRQVGAALACAFGTLHASAITLTWTLEGVTFSDGGAATGWFVYDADSFTVTDWSITVSPWTFPVPDPMVGPDEYTVPKFTYATLNPSFSAVYRLVDRMRIDWYEPSEYYPGNPPEGSLGWRQLLMGFEEFLDAPKTVALDVTTAFGRECWDCVPSRLLISGSVVAVPESSAWVSFSAGLAVLAGFAGRRAILSARQRTSGRPRRSR